MQKLGDEVAKVNVVMTGEQKKKVEEWRWQQPDKPNLSLAIRRLLDQALENPVRRRRQ
jgi:hypothetical protein